MYKQGGTGFNRVKSVPLFLLLASFSSFASVDIFTVPDDPYAAKKDFAINAEGSYSHQSGNSRTSTFSANSTITWFRGANAYSIWGEGYNYTSDDTRSSEKYQAGIRSRHNYDNRNFLFSQASWLSDRFNGYSGREVFVTGYGRQIFTGPVHNLRAETGPGVRHDSYTDGDDITNALIYGALSYSYKLTDNARFIQGISVLGSSDTTVNSETGIQVSLSKNFALKVTYNYTHNSEPPASAPDKTDTKTQISVVYTLPQGG